MTPLPPVEPEVLAAVVLFVAGWVAAAVAAVLVAMVGRAVGLDPRPGLGFRWAPIFSLLTFVGGTFVAASIGLGVAGEGQALALFGVWAELITRMFASALVLAGTERLALANAESTVLGAHTPQKIWFVGASIAALSVAPIAIPAIPLMIVALVGLFTFRPDWVEMAWRNVANLAAAARLSGAAGSGTVFRTEHGDELKVRDVGLTRASVSTSEGVVEMEMRELARVWDRRQRA